MEGERLKKIADALRVKGRKRRVGWEDCVKRDLAGAGREWRMRTRDGEGDGGDDSEMVSTSCKR